MFSGVMREVGNAREGKGKKIHEFWDEGWIE